MIGSNRLQSFSVNEKIIKVHSWLPEPCRAGGRELGPRVRLASLWTRGVTDFLICQLLVAGTYIESERGFFFFFLVQTKMSQNVTEPTAPGE